MGIVFYIKLSSAKIALPQILKVMPKAGFPPPRKCCLNAYVLKSDQTNSVFHFNKQSGKFEKVFS